MPVEKITDTHGAASALTCHWPFTGRGTFSQSHHHLRAKTYGKDTMKAVVALLHLNQS